MTGLLVWRKDGWWGALLQSFRPLSLSYHVSFSLSFPSTPAYCSVDLFVAGSHFSLLCSLLSLLCSCKSSCRLHKYKRAFFGVVVFATLASFVSALFLRLSPWQPWQLGKPTKGLSLFYPLGRLERIKTVLMGTNTPHTCIPGLVWQKQARRFSQFELKVGELRFPIHFVCVSAALYHRGVRGRHFPQVNTAHSLSDTIFSQELIWSKVRKKTLTFNVNDSIKVS